MVARAVSAAQSGNRNPLTENCEINFSLYQQFRVVHVACNWPGLVWPGHVAAVHVALMTRNACRSCKCCLLPTALCPLASVLCSLCCVLFPCPARPEWILCFAQAVAAFGKRQSKWACGCLVPAASLGPCRVQILVCSGATLEALWQLYFSFSRSARQQAH